MAYAVSAEASRIELAFEVVQYEPNRCEMRMNVKSKQPLHFCWMVCSISTALG